LFDINETHTPNALSVWQRAFC